MISDEREVNSFGCITGRPEHAGGHAIGEAQIWACRAWICAHATRSKTIRKKHSSYGLKHYVEDWTARLVRNGERILPIEGRPPWDGSKMYIPNGAFIVAALREGYRAEQLAPGSLNAFFNMSFQTKWAFT